MYGALLGFTFRTLSLVATLLSHALLRFSFIRGQLSISSTFRILFVTSVSRAILGIRILFYRIVTLVSGALLGILFLGVFR